VLQRPIETTGIIGMWFSARIVEALTARNAAVLAARDERFLGWCRGVANFINSAAVSAEGQEGVSGGEILPRLFFEPGEIAF
jgi:hypothetical protein